MLARLPLPIEYAEFNRKWGAPSGTRFYRLSRKRPALKKIADRLIFTSIPKLRGYFSYQVNSNSRVFEYPWCFYASPLKTGMRVVDLGGSLSGFQFLLATQGLDVINVDPGLEAHGLGWPVDQSSIAYLNKAFGTNVCLENCFLQEAKLSESSIDRVFSISVVEHIPESELKSLMSRVWEILRPNGLFIATVDLFLDIKPFSSKANNKYGTNIPIPLLSEAAPFALVSGIRSELYGYPEFSVDSCMRQLDVLLIGEYPTLVQCIVLKKIS